MYKRQLFAILLFTVLPTVLVGGLNHLVPLGRWGKVILEAVLKAVSYTHLDVYKRQVLARRSITTS